MDDPICETAHYLSVVAHGGTHLILVQGGRSAEVGYVLIEGLRAETSSLRNRLRNTHAWRQVRLWLRRSGVGLDSGQRPPP